MMRSFGAVDHLVTVRKTEFVAPHVVRVSMHSQTLLDELPIGPTNWARFWFPDESGFEHQRGYTLVEPDPQTGDFSCDFVIHDPAGPASKWAARAKPGDRLEAMVMGSQPFEVSVDTPAGYLLVGDSASLPAVNQILKVIPEHVPVEVYLEQHDSSDALLRITEHPRASVHWIPREEVRSLAQTIESRDWSDWYAWMAPETGSLRALRTRLTERFGFPKSAQYGRAYWSEGKAMGKDREASERRSPSYEDSSGAGNSVQTEDKRDASLRGRWKSQGSAELLRPLKPTFWVAGIVQVLVTLLELSPFVLLAQLASQLASGASVTAMRGTMIAAVVLMLAGALLGIGLMFWLHMVDARFERDLRSRLLMKFAKLPLSWFSSRNSSQVKRLVQDDPLWLHYLVTHAVPDAVAAVVSPVAVLVYLFIVQWRLALPLLIPVLVYLVIMYVMLVASAEKTPQATKWAEVMDGEAASYIDAQPVVRIFGGSSRSTFNRRLGEYVRFLGDWQRPFSSKKALMDIATRPSTFLLVIVVFGTLLITTGGMTPAQLLPFLFLGTTFGSRLLGLGYGLGALRDGMTAAGRINKELEQRELEVRETGLGTNLSQKPGISISDLSFEYEPGVPVLEGLRLHWSVLPALANRH